MALLESSKKRKLLWTIFMKPFCGHGRIYNSVTMVPELENAGSPTQNDVERIPQKAQEWLHRSEHNQPQFEEERKKLERNDFGVPEDLSECAAAAHDCDDGGFIPQRMSGHPAHQQLPNKEEGELEKQLRRIKEQYHEEVEGNQQLELALSTLKMEFSTLKNDLNQVREKQNNIHRHLSGQENIRTLQDEMQVTHLCQQQEVDTAAQERDDEIQELESHLHQLGDSKETHPVSEHSLNAVRNYYYYLEDEINIIKKIIVEFQRQYQESQHQQNEMVPSIEKIQDHLKMFNQKYSKFKNVVLHQARLTKKQEILLKRISANLTHVHQQHDGLEKKQSEIEALLRDVGQFYLQFRNESQDARNSLDEFHRKLQESETVHLEKLQYAEKSLDDLEHCASRLRCESLKLQSNLRLCADSIEELQRILADVKYLQEQYDNLKQRQSGSEASPEDVEGFYHRLKQKTREIMEKLGKINREAPMN